MTDQQSPAPSPPFDVADPVQLFIGAGERPVFLETRYANRHGLIAGATGTGKTVTLQILAESFSARGVPVFLADVKGDLAGLSQPGADGAKLKERAERIGLQPYVGAGCPVVFWDVYGVGGHPLRTTISEFGPLLLARALELSDAQEGVLNVAFRVADEQGLLLLDLADLRSLLGYVGEHRKELSQRYGLVSPSSLGAIQRRLLTLENAGGQHFLGEPALELSDLMRIDLSGRGIVNVLAADQLVNQPRLYSTVLLWLLAELFEELPEVGDPDKPRLVLFFDEAHLLFDDATDVLLDKVEQAVRLIRSKGVGIYFVTQSPLDLPAPVLGQLGNRFQHALRAYTPSDQRSLRAAAQTFRQNPAFDAEKVLIELGLGEALVSTLEARGVPGIVERCLIRPPSSRIGPIADEERSQLRSRSPVAGRYEQAVDRESAYEVLQARAQRAASEQPESDKAERAASRRQGYGEAFTKSVLRSVGSQLGRSLGSKLLRGLLGSLTRG